MKNKILFSLILLLSFATFLGTTFLLTGCDQSPQSEIETPDDTKDDSDNDKKDDEDVEGKIIATIAIKVFTMDISGSYIQSGEGGYARLFVYKLNTTTQYGDTLQVGGRTENNYGATKYTHLLWGNFSLEFVPYVDSVQGFSLESVVFMDKKNGNTTYTYPQYEKIKVNISGDRSEGECVFVMYCSRNRYDITFNAKGGICSETKRTRYYGEPYGTLPIPTKEGYSFAGWYRSSGGNLVTADYKTVQNNDLYAKWVKVYFPTKSWKDVISSKLGISYDQITAVTIGTSASSVDCGDFSGVSTGGEFIKISKPSSSSTNVYFSCSSTIYAPSDCGYLFSGMTSLKRISFSNFDTSEMTDMQSMFRECPALETINGLTNFDTSKVTEMSNMFWQDSKLKTLDLSSFSTASNTGGLGHTFAECSSLTSITFGPNFTASKEPWLDNLFKNCSSLQSLDLSHWTARSAVSFEGMFTGCSSLVTLDLSSLYTTNVTTMENMFSYCPALEQIFISKEKFNTSKCTNFWRMFSGCSSLWYVDTSSFNTASANHLSYMFEGCSKIEKLDLSSFTISSSVTVDSMLNLGTNEYFKWLKTPKSIATDVAITGVDLYNKYGTKISTLNSSTQSDTLVVKNTVTLRPESVGKGETTATFDAQYLYGGIGFDYGDANWRFMDGSQAIPPTGVGSNISVSGNTVTSGANSVDTYFFIGVPAWQGYEYIITFDCSVASNTAWTFAPMDDADYTQYLVNGKNTFRFTSKVNREMFLDDKDRTSSIPFTISNIRVKMFNKDRQVFGGWKRNLIDLESWQKWLNATRGKNIDSVVRMKANGEVTMQSAQHYMNSEGIVYSVSVTDGASTKKGVYEMTYTSRSTSTDVSESKPVGAFRVNGASSSDESGLNITSTTDTNYKGTFTFNSDATAGFYLSWNYGYQTVTNGIYFKYLYDSSDQDTAYPSWGIVSSSNPFYISRYLVPLWIGNKVNLTIKVMTNTEAGTNTYTNSATGFSSASIYFTKPIVNGQANNKGALTTLTAATTTVVINGNELSPFNITTVIPKSGYVYKGYSSTNIYIYDSNVKTSIKYSYEDATIYMWFKKVSDNKIQYDSTEKYWYFEDGMMLQSYVGTTMNSTLNKNIDKTSSGVDSIGYWKNGVWQKVNLYSYSGETYGYLTAPKTATVKLSGTNYSFTKGQTYWFKYEPIRWRVSELGVSSTSYPSGWYDLGAYKSNFNAVSHKLIFASQITNSEFKLGSGKCYLDSDVYSSRESIVKESTFDYLTETNASYIKFGGGASGSDSVSQSANMKIRVASVAELQANFSDLRATATDYVAVMLSVNTDQYHNYFTRDVGKKYYNMIGIGVDGRVHDYYSNNFMGMRLAMTFSEGSRY